MALYRLLKNSALGPEEISRKDLAFAQSVRYTEGKRRYYSISEKKVSSSESKRFDTRWAEIPTWADGSVGSIARLLTGDKSIDLLALYRLYLDAYQYVARELNIWSDRPEKTLKLDNGNYLSVDAAFSAAACAVEAKRALKRARRILDSYTSNLQREQEPAADTSQAVSQ